jgi:hypothetical protein
MTTCDTVLIPSPYIWCFRHYNISWLTSLSQAKQNQFTNSAIYPFTGTLLCRRWASPCPRPCHPWLTFNLERIVFSSVSLVIMNKVGGDQICWSVSVCNSLPESIVIFMWGGKGRWWEKCDYLECLPFSQYNVIFFFYFYFFLWTEVFLNAELLWML